MTNNLPENANGANFRYKIRIRYEILVQGYFRDNIFGD